MKRAIAETTAHDGLSDPSWHLLRAVAKERQITILQLVEEINRSRKCSLSTAIQDYILQFYRDYRSAHQ